MNKTPVIPQTDYPKSNIPYRVINHPFRFGFIVPGKGITIEKDSNGILYISSESGMDVADLVAGDNIEITRTEDGKIVVSAVNTVADIAAGQNVSIDIDPETGTAIINSVVDGETNEHYQGVFDTTDELIDYDTNPEEGDYGLVKNVRYSDGGADTWNGQYKYCFFIGGVWTVVDQMLTFTDNIELIQQYYSVGGSSPVIYLHKVARTGDFNDLRNVPIVATPVVTVEGTTVTATCATEGAEIYYTTDGSMPHVTGNHYTGPVTVAQATTFRFVAIKNGMINSLEAVANADYELQAPTINLDYRTGEVSMENPNLDGNGDPIGAIYYTTDDSTPTDQSTPYTESFIITSDTNFKVIVINSDDNHESPVTIKKYYKLYLDGRHTGGNNIIGTAVYNIRSFSSFMQEVGEVHYTDDGETPTFGSALLDRFEVPYYGGLKIIKTKAFAEGYVPSDIDSWPLGSDKPVSPPINFDADTNMVSLVESSFVSNGIAYGRISGLYCEAVFKPVSVSYPARLRARIYYTLDGSTPDENSTVYTGPFAVTNGQTVKAIVIAYGQYYSDVATKEITILRMPSATFNSDTGALTLIEQNTGGIIYYTTDGSTPTDESEQYVSPIVLTEETVVKCVSVVENVGQSKVAVYGYEQATQPVITQSNLDMSTGNYQIVMSSDSKWKTIHYTLDGSTPTYQSPVFSNAINKNIFDGQVTVKAIVIYSEQIPSGVVTETFGESAVSAPEITVDNETNKVTVELSGNTANIPLQTNDNVPSMGARIYYTTDGSTPTAESTLYTGPFSVPAGSLIIKAITVCYGNYTSQLSVCPLYLSAPVITLLHGQQSGVNVEGKVVIQNNNDFGTIHYTTDGSTPTANSTVFADGDYIDIMANTTVKAVVIYSPTGLTSSVASLNVKMATLYALTNDPDYGICESLSGRPFPASGEKYYFDDYVVSIMIDITAVPASGYDFVKFQSSNDGINWQDIQGGPFLTVDIGAGGTYYRRAVFEQEVQSGVNLIFRVGAIDDFDNPVDMGENNINSVLSYIASEAHVDGLSTDYEDWEMDPIRGQAIYPCNQDVSFITKTPTSVDGDGGMFYGGDLSNISSEYHIISDIYEGIIEISVGNTDIVIDITYVMHRS